MPYLILQRKTGTGSATVQLPGANSTEVAPGSTSLTFYSNGTVGIGAAGITLTSPWWAAAPLNNIGAQYQIRATLVSGSSSNLGGAALGSWLDLNTLKTWTLNNTIPDGPIELLIEIRDLSTSTVQASGTYTLELS